MKSFKFYSSRKDAEKKGDAEPNGGLGRTDFLGMLIGIPVALLILSSGQFGLVPAVLIIWGCCWAFKKIAENDRPISDLWKSK